jgi:hypothetical protein
VVTSQLIKDLQDLLLAGNDASCLWKKRHVGMSLYSLAPADEGSIDGELVRDRMIAFEDTLEHHTPDQREAMSSLSRAMSSAPTDRPGMYRWIDHATHLYEMFLGEDCPLIAPLGLLLDALHQPNLYLSWKDKDFLVLGWMLHLGVRQFFQGKPLVLLNKIVSDASVGLKIPHSQLPPELSHAPTSHGGGSTAGGGGGTSRGGQGGDPPSKKPRSENPPQGAPFASRWKSHLDKAAKAVAPRVLSGVMFCGRGEALTGLLGDDFISLAPSGTTLCARYFILGRCVDGNSCKFTHSLTKDPSKAVLDGLTERIKARADAITRDPKGAGGSF